MTPVLAPTLLLPRCPEASVTALARPCERLTDMRVEEAAAHLGYLHADSVRKRTRGSWTGPGERLHAHHTSGGSKGGELLFKAAVLNAWLDGADYAAQVRICGAKCPEARVASSAAAPAPSRAAFSSPGRRR